MVKRIHKVLKRGRVPRLVDEKGQGGKKEVRCDETMNNVIQYLSLRYRKWNKFFSKSITSYSILSSLGCQ